MINFWGFIMKKSVMLLIVLFVVSMGTIVTSEIPQSRKEEDLFIDAASDDIASLCKGYEKHLDELLDALEKCAKSDTRNDVGFFLSGSESCAQCLPIMAKPEHVNFDMQMKNRLDEAYDYLNNKEEKKYILQMLLALQEKIGDEFTKKLQRQNELSGVCQRRLYATRNEMIRDIDLGQFNADLPDILRNACEQPQGKLTKDDYCAEIQKMFQIRMANLNGEYSPFSANIMREGFERRIVLGTVPVNPDNLRRNVEHLCSNLLELSEETTSHLVQLTMDGYNGNGKCEKGNRQLEKRIDKIIEENSEEQN